MFLYTENATVALLLRRCDAPVLPLKGSAVPSGSPGERRSWRPAGRPRSAPAPRAGPTARHCSPPRARRPPPSLYPRRRPLPRDPEAPEKHEGQRGSRATYLGSISHLYACVDCNRPCVAQPSTPNQSDKLDLNGFYSFHFQNAHTFTVSHYSQLI